MSLFFRRFFLSLLPILTLCSGAAGAANPEYDRALSSIEAMTASLESYQVTGSLEMTMAMAGMPEPMEMKASLRSAARWPDRLISSQEGAMFNLNLGVGPEQSWFYLGQMGTCYQGGEVQLNREMPDGPAMDMSPEKIFNFYGGLGHALLAPGLEIEAEILSEQVALGGREVTCQVFTTVPSSAEERAAGQAGHGSRRYWFDPQSSLVLRAEVNILGKRNGMDFEQNIVFNMDSFTLNEPVPEELFSFSPPAGTRIVDHLDRLANPDAMTGQVAPEVTFTDFAGKPVSLQDFRGKVVFLDFWATWCGPCKIEMPHIQTLHEELGDSGEVVFLAASSEDQGTIEGFLAKTPYTFQVVRVSAEDMHSKFKASSIPVGFVIDRQGVIQAHMVGAQSEAQLRQALARAGIGP